MTDERLFTFAGESRVPTIERIRTLREEQRKLVRFFRLQRWEGFPPPAEPTFDDDTRLEFLKQLGRSNGYLEFGSGGSTIAADKLGVRTLTVEADRFFARVVRRALSRRTQVEVMDVRIGLTREWSVPVFTRPSRGRLRSWERYIREPFERLARLEWFPDFILIDGRFRRACVLQSVHEAVRLGRPAVIMFDDYFNEGRSHYHGIEKWLGAPARAGRAALFHISPATVLSPVKAEDIAEAIRDFR